MKSNLETVRYLIEHAKADVNGSNQYKQTPLMLAFLAANDASIAEYLLKYTNVDPNAQDSVITTYVH